MSMNTHDSVEKFPRKVCFELIKCWWHRSMFLPYHVRCM